MSSVRAEKSSTLGGVIGTVLDTLPVAAFVWNSPKDVIDCNQAALELFSSPDKRRCISDFVKFSPEFQPNGKRSDELILETNTKALEKGFAQLEWMHQGLNGEELPCDVTISRLEKGDSLRLISYALDLRKFKKLNDSLRTVESEQLSLESPLAPSSCRKIDSYFNSASGLDDLKNTVKRLDQLESIAYIDSGTDVYNRRYFMDKAEKAFALSDPMQIIYGIIMIDIDEFKKINDTFGHPYGDYVLREVAQAMNSILRPEDLFARYGGEEFIVLFREGRRGASKALAERIRKTVESLEINHQGNVVKITVSLGTALQSSASDSVREVIARADSKLYRAKRNGRNRSEHDDCLPLKQS